MRRPSQRLFLAQLPLELAQPEARLTAPDLGAYGACHGVFAPGNFQTVDRDLIDPVPRSTLKYFGVCANTLKGPM